MNEKQKKKDNVAKNNQTDAISEYYHSLNNRSSRNCWLAFQGLKLLNTFFKNDMKWNLLNLAFHKTIIPFFVEKT